MTYQVTSDIQGLIFDFDGTVVDSMPAHYLSWRAAFSSYGCDFSEQFCYDNAGLSLTGVVALYNREMKTDLPPDDVVALKGRHHVAFLDEIEPIPQVLAVIRRYHGRLKMAVATGSVRELTEPLMARLDLARYFETVVCGEDVAHGKPHPASFLKAASAMTVPAARCEVFEDGDAGLEAARRAGMKATDIRPWLI